MGDVSDYLSAFFRNLEIFRRNYPTDYADFESIINSTAKVWARAGVERDLEGQSNAGLLPFVNLLVRHAIFGFQHLASYQSFLGWYLFRPGLEAFLIIGKFADNPSNAAVWENRDKDWKAYERTFSRKNIISQSLPRSGDLQQVLKRLNDDFMHPNPNFTWRHMAGRPQDRNMILELHYFDCPRENIHEMNVLAYINLLDIIRQSSLELTNRMFGHYDEDALVPYAEKNSHRAATIAGQNPAASAMMAQFGLWSAREP